jgi:hypothetical protein
MMTCDMGETTLKRGSHDNQQQPFILTTGIVIAEVTTVKKVI